MKRKYKITKAKILFSLFLLFSLIAWCTNTKLSKVKISQESRLISTYQKEEGLVNGILNDTILQSNILRYLPSNYSQKGNIDYTSYLQRAFNENRNIIMPNFPIAVNFNGINIPSNTTVLFQNKSKLIVLPNDKINYQAMMLSNVHNVTITRPTLVGDRENHLGKTGEWGMGIRIMSSQNINIVDPFITEFWGDGIFVSRNITPGSVQYSSDVKITGGELSHNRRNGISIISGQNITVQGTVIRNTEGTSPMAGIDVEPDRGTDRLVNIVLNDVRTIDNRMDGIKVVFSRMLKPNKISIEIEGHYDEGSKYPFTIVGWFKNLPPREFSGAIKYRNYNWHNYKGQIRKQRDYLSTIQLQMIKK